MPEVAQHTDTICELADTVSKYGWTAVKNSDGDCELFNRNGKKVVVVKIKGEKYTFFHADGDKLMSGRGQLQVSTEKLLTQYFYAKKEMAGGGKSVGGMLVGKSDINGREGILALQPTGELLRVGGGEIVMSEKASTENCETLSKMNEEAGGNKIPCEIKHVANTDRASGKMPKDEYYKGDGKGRMLYGGRVGYKKLVEIDDSLYMWKYSGLTLYALYKSGRECMLGDLIDHPALFADYPNMRKINVYFNNGINNAGGIDMLGDARGFAIALKTKITITLNFDYYHENKKELETSEGGNPEDSKESILLHELQHVLQATHNRPAGTSAAEAGLQADARMDALRNRKESGRITSMESDELYFYDGLTKIQLHDFFYYNDSGEREARKVVRGWLLKKGIRYVDPLTTDYDIEIVDENLSGGGSITKKPYYFLTKSEIVSERDRLEALPQPLVCEDLSRMRALHRMSIIKHNVLLSKLDAVMDNDSNAEGGTLTKKDVRSGIVIISKWLPDWSLFSHAGIISIENGKAFVYDNDPDNPLNDKGGQVMRTSLDEYLKTKEVLQFYDSGVSSERIQEQAKKYWNKKFDWFTFNCETFIKLVTGKPIKRNVLMPIEKIGMVAIPLSIGIALDGGGESNIGGHIVGGIFGGATAALVESAVAAEAGGCIMEKPYYLLTKDEVISERERLTELMDNWSTEEAKRMQSLQRYSVAEFGVLLEKLKS